MAGGWLSNRSEAGDTRARARKNRGASTEAKAESPTVRPKPGEIFAGRLLAAGKDADACVKLAQWARVNGLDHEYVLALRRALQIDSDHTEATEQLHRCRQRLYYLPTNNEAAKNILAEMGPGFRIMRTRHYRICYNCSGVFAEICGDLLEEVYHGFMAFFHDRGLEPAPITDRLEVVLFDNRDEFRRYAGAISAEMAGSAGFYYPSIDRSYFYDSINNPNYRENYRRLQEARDELSRNREKVQQNTNLTVRWTVTDADGIRKELNNDEMARELDRQEQILLAQERELWEVYRSLNISITVHEATHQLAYSCGIHSRYYNNPKWLVEGLALYFEPAAVGKWLGPGQVHTERLTTFCQVDRKTTRSAGSRLEELISTDDLFDLSNSRASAAYADAWALFYYLSRQQHEALFDYIYDLSLRIADTPYTARQRRNDFDNYFGHLELLEHRWLAHMAGVTK